MSGPWYPIKDHQAYLVRGSPSRVRLGTTRESLRSVSNLQQQSLGWVGLVARPLLHTRRRCRE